MDQSSFSNGYNSIKSKTKILWFSNTGVTKGLETQANELDLTSKYLKFYICM